MRFALALAVVLVSVSVSSPLTSRGDEASPRVDWRSLDKIVGSVGVSHDDVVTFVLPRTDLDVAIDGMAVPVAAGLASEFHFYQCPCGKARVVGQFCCADYEANDVVDAVRAGGLCQIAGMGPMFTGDRPRLTIIRVQGEGDATALAKVLRDGLGWMGTARLTAQQGVAATQPGK